MNTDKIKEIQNETKQEQLRIGTVMWRCSRQFRMKDTKEACFKNGGLYEQVKKQPLTLKDEDGIAHKLAPHWTKWFHDASQQFIGCDIIALSIIIAILVILLSY